jgi:hypothetical protein
MGEARVPLSREDINKLREMLDTALNQSYSADTRDTSTAIGVIESYERSGLALSSTQQEGVRSFKMLVVGTYGVPRLRFNLSYEEIKELNRLLTKAIKELNKNLPLADSLEQPK